MPQEPISEGAKRESLVCQLIKESDTQFGNPEIQRGQGDYEFHIYQFAAVPESKIDVPDKPRHAFRFYATLKLTRTILKCWKNQGVPPENFPAYFFQFVVDRLKEGELPSSAREPFFFTLDGYNELANGPQNVYDVSLIRPEEKFILEARQVPIGFVPHDRKR